jgi:hypothetical protein
MVMWGTDSAETDGPAAEQCDSGWDYGNQILCFAASLAGAAATATWRLASTRFGFGDLIFLAGMTRAGSVGIWCVEWYLDRP